RLELLVSLRSSQALVVEEEMRRAPGAQVFGAIQYSIAALFARASAEGALRLREAQAVAGRHLKQPLLEGVSVEELRRSFPESFIARNPLNLGAQPSYRQRLFVKIERHVIEHQAHVLGKALTHSLESRTHAFAKRTLKFRELHDCDQGILWTDAR